MAGTVLHVRGAQGCDRSWLRDAAERAALSVVPASTRAEALAALESSDVDCVVVERAVGGEEEGSDPGGAGIGEKEGGLPVLDAIRDGYPDLPVILWSAAADGELAAAATRRGVTEYYPDGSSDEPLLDRVSTYVPDERADASSNADATTLLDGGSARGDSFASDREYYEAVIEGVDDGVYALDDAGEFVFVNDAMAELTGYAPEELYGEHTSLIKDDASVARAERLVRGMLCGETDEATFELEIRPQSGDPIPCEDHMTVLTDDGEFVGTAGVIRDVSERKRRERRLSGLLSSAQSLMGAHSREEVARLVAEATAETLDLELNVVRLHDEEAGLLRAAASTADADETLGDRPPYPVGEDGPGRAFAAGEVLRYPDDVDDDDIDSPGPIETAVYLPLGDHGTLSLGATEPDAFDGMEVSLAEFLASTAAVALDRAAREEELVRYETVLENVQDMVYVIDADGRFSLVTEPLADWLGYDREELMGTPAKRVVRESDRDALEALIADLWHSDDPDASRTVETALVTADGERRPVEAEISLFPAGDEFAGTVGVVRDPTELVRTQELLETERDRFSYLFDNLPDAVVETAFDEDHRPIVETVNESFTEVFGYDADAIRGEPLNDFVLPPDRREEGRRLDRRAAEGDPHQVEVRRRTADGYRDFLFRGIPYETSGDRPRGFGIYTDITEQKERERRLEVLNRVLRHNLRNDLNVVLGYADMLAADADDGALTERATALRKKAAELSSLGDRARRLERTIGAGQPRESSVDLSTLVGDVVAEFRAEHPSLSIETDVESLSVAGDSRLELALSELLENAVEHCDDPTVVVETVRDDGLVALRVADDGPGIPETERAVIAGRAEITQLRHGSGLGLWVAKWVSESCGGRLRFEESRLGGTAVVLSLNLLE